MSGWTDTHAHLSYLTERGIGNETIGALFEQGGLRSFDFILDIGTEPGDLDGRIKGFSRYKKARFACGIWPHKELLEKRLEAVKEIERDINAAPCGLISAIGECGFDRRENPEAPNSEVELFELQLALAQKLNLPVIVHSREAPEETLLSLKKFSDVCAVIHCFSYDKELLKKFLDINCYISFAGNLTYKNAHNLREALPVVSKERLFLETDSPYLAPQAFRGKICHPGMISETYTCAAGLLHIDIEDLKNLIYTNAAMFFNLNFAD